MNQNRNKLLTMLDEYSLRNPDDGCVEGFRRFIDRQPRCFQRDCFDDGHITASALVLNHQRTACLLTRHAKLGKWLQLGGHSDGNPNPLAVAVREAQEESQLDVRPISEQILDIDIHDFPQRGEEPEHRHYDVRFLLEVSGSERFQVTEESLDLKWICLDLVRSFTNEPSILRLLEKWPNLKKTARSR